MRVCFGLRRFGDQVDQVGGGECFRGCGLFEVQRECGDGVSRRAGQIGFRAIGIYDGQGIIGKQLGGQGDFHFAFGLGELARVFERDGHEFIAVFGIAHAYGQFARRQMLARRLGSIDQREVRAIRNIAADGADRKRTGIRGSGVLRVFDRCAFGLADVIAALALTGRGMRAIAVRSPFANQCSSFFV